MFKVEKTFTFDAAHRLHKMSNGHKCRNLHGHTYAVTVTVELNHLTDTDVVLDFNNLSKAVEPLIQHLDHKVLVAETDINLIQVLANIDTKYKVLPIQSTTSELLAEYIASNVSKFFKSEFLLEDFTLIVSVSETPKTKAIYHMVG